MAFGVLWGLVACHSYGPHGMRVSFPVRQMLRLLSQSISKNIERLSYASRLHTRKLVCSRGVCCCETVLKRGADQHNIVEPPSGKLYISAAVCCTLLIFYLPVLDWVHHQQRGRSPRAFRRRLRYTGHWRGCEDLGTKPTWPGDPDRGGIPSYQAVQVRVCD